MAYTSSNQNLTTYTINVEFLSSSQDIVNGNILNIPIVINKTQAGTDNLFIGKKLNIFVGNKSLIGTYQQKTDNTEFLRINNINVFAIEDIQFNTNTLHSYNEISNTTIDSIPVTINDIKRLFKPTKNLNGFKGFTGLLEPLHLEAIESIKFIREVTQKNISELLSYTTTTYYETLNNETNTQIQFGVFHSLFNIEFELKIFGNNFTLKVIRFGSATLLNNINIALTINKIPSNDSSKQLYQILTKLNNIPVNIQSNVEKVRCYINENLTTQTVYSNLPINYNLSNSTISLTEKIFSRYTLYYDNNGIVSLNPNESIKLTSNQNLNNLTNIGWYHYDILNLSDIILNNLPNGNKNIFYLNVKRLSDDLLIQYLYLYDTTKNVIKTYSRIRNNNTLIYSNWLEFVSQDHKHLPSDIITDANNLFVTQAQINLWNSYQTSLSDYWNNAVATKANLPPTGLNGESRLVLSEMKIYVYVAIDSIWVSVTDPKIYLNITNDNVKILINEGGLNREILLPIVTDNNPGLVSSDFNAGNYKEYFESNLNFTVENTGTDIPGNYQKQLDYTFNLLINDGVKINDGVTNYILGTNGQTRTIDLTVISDKINKTFYSVYNNQNIYSGIVDSFQFILKSNQVVTTKIIFGTDKTVNIIDQNGSITQNTNTELNLTYEGCDYIFNISGNIINIYKFTK